MGYVLVTATAFVIYRAVLAIEVYIAMHLKLINDYAYTYPITFNCALASLDGCMGQPHVFSQVIGRHAL